MLFEEARSREILLSIAMSVKRKGRQRKGRQSSFCTLDGPLSITCLNETDRSSHIPPNALVSSTRQEISKKPDEVITFLSRHAFFSRRFSLCDKAQ